MMLLAMGLVVYVICASLFLSRPDEGEKCQAVELIVSQGSASPFMDKEEVEAILKNARIYPTGMLMKDVNTKKIEETLRKNEFNAEAECYKSANGKLCISVKQRIPVIYVSPDEKDGYFVDAKGKIIPNRNCAMDLVVASGNIDNKYASTKLAEFGCYLQKNEFWNRQIEQIYVTKNKKGERVVELIPRVGEQIVYLGPLDDFESKLRRLRLFYSKAIDAVGWEKYARVNLEYDNQIICTKR